MRNAIFASLVISALLWADGATARRQPIADDTLGGERSLVTPTEINGIPSDLITEGAQRGSNLFHSFQEFSIDEGRAAYFNNPDGVENIFGRVTGGNQSDILGRLGVLGEANLFLINPNGIQFGPNASLDIGGSFLATTADAVGFGDQGWFSAATPEVPSPLLTIHPSAFFYNRMRASPITVRSTTPVDTELGIVGLSVGVGENLALLGGDITVEGEGRLNARGGRIDLGAVESTGTIGLNADRSFSFPVEVRRGEIVFTEAARADVRTPGSGGTIAMTAQHINITEGGQLLAGILSGQGFLGSQAGGIELNASEQILMTQSSYIQNEVALDARGNAGNIEITTPILEVLDGAQLSASTRGQGNAGRVAIIVSDRVTFSGVDKNSRFISSAALSRVEQSGNGAGGNIEISTPILEVLDRAALSASTRGQGKAGRVIITASDRVTFNRGVALSNVLAGSDGAGGDIEITTPLLEILNGARLSSSTLGIGEAGRVVIVASDRVLLDGVSSSGFSSGIFGSTASNITGRGGKVSVTTPYLQISKGAVISVRTVNAQLGGGIIIDANQVRAIEGGQIITSTTNAGQAGTITINADSTHFSGRDPSFTRRLQEFGRVITSNEGNGESGLFANTRTDSTGAGGNITVNTNDLIVCDYAQISAQSQGTGAAGNVRVQAQDTILLDGHASINSDTRGGEGDIDLASRLLLLRDSSTITTNASGPATGGNIDIEADFIVAAANENNDIFANAVEGSGGQINLTARAIFGLESRTRAELQELLGDDPNTLSPRNLSSNDVTAFSQANPTIDVGTVTFLTPDIDPSQGLLELPDIPLAAADQIVQVCPSGGGRVATSLQNEFVVTGRGGLPTNPLAPLEGDGILAGWASLDDEADTAPVALPEEPVEMRERRAIVEATSWRRDAGGNVVLMAAAGISQLPLSLTDGVSCRE